MSTLYSTDGGWQQLNPGSVSILFSLLAFCLAVPAKAPWTFLNSELLQILQRPSAK